MRLVGVYPRQGYRKKNTALAELIACGLISANQPEIDKVGSSGTESGRKSCQANTIIATGNTHLKPTIIPVEDPNFYIEIKGNYTGTISGSTNELFGCSEGGIARFYFGLLSGLLTLGYKENFIQSVGLFDNNEHIFRVTGDGKLLIDGLLIHDLSSSIGTFPNIEAYIFGRNTDGLATQMSNFDLKYVTYHFPNGDEYYLDIQNDSNNNYGLIPNNVENSQIIVVQITPPSPKLKTNLTEVTLQDKYGYLEADTTQFMDEGLLIQYDNGFKIPNYPNTNISASWEEEIQPLTMSFSPQANIQGFGTELYSFGVLSDTHIADTNYVADSTNSLIDYERALTVLKPEVDFIAIPGDVLKNNHSVEYDNTLAQNEWVGELQKFKELNETYFTGKEVYATTGNHDAGTYGYNNDPEGMDAIIASYGDGTKTAREIWNEVLGRDINFTFNQGNDTFIFLGFAFWNYVNFCKDEAIPWFENLLELNKNKRVFLFQHAPIQGMFPVGSQDVGLILLDGLVGRSGDFKKLFDKYSNVIWFSGHSHYGLEYASTIENANMYQSGKSMTGIHACSGTVPRVVNGESYLNVDEGSQGWKVKVYENGVDIIGLDFTNVGNEEISEARICLKTEVT